MSNARMTEKIYSLLMRRNAPAEAELPAGVREHVPANGLRLISANALQSTGDQIVNASTVLAWLFSTLGVPAALTGVLVPIRESGSMLPQAFLTPIVLRARRRKWVFVAGALVQAAAVGVIATTAAIGSGLPAGIAIIAALAIFSFGRCLCSITSKDVQGRTVPKGERGQINGLATTAAGLVAITLGLAIRLLGADGLTPGQLAALLAGAAMLWLAAAAVYAGIREPAHERTSVGTRQETVEPGWVRQMRQLLGEDALFRSFVLVRSLLLVSALSPPFIVVLSVESGASSLAGLGGFIIASGLAALLGGRIFGQLADRSSKRLMSVGAGLASLIIVITVAMSLLTFTESGAGGTVIFVGAYFLLTLTHTAVRVARKTYIVDMAEGDRRTVYTAVSNSVMGIMLLVVGGISSLLAVAHVNWALLFLAALGLIGVFAGARLPDVSRAA